MATIKELIRVESNESISFGDYELTEKKKVVDFDVEGDLYKVKTYDAMTKLEKNGILVYESVPGTAVHGFVMTEQGASFTVESAKNANVTIELAPETEYKIFIDKVQVDRVTSNLSGKVTFSIEESSTGRAIKIDKVN